MGQPASALSAAALSLSTEDSIGFLAPQTYPTPLFDVGDLFDVLTSDSSCASGLVVTLHNDIVAPEKYLIEGDGDSFIDGEALAGLIDAGASVVVRNVDRWTTKVNDVRDALSDVDDREVICVAFYSPPTAGAFRLHQDPAPVLAIQMSGVKNWRVYRHFDGMDETGELVRPDGAEPVLRVTTEPGSVLYMPALIPHQAVSARAEASLHLSFVLRPGPAPEASTDDMPLHPWPENAKTALRQALRLAHRPGGPQ